MMSGEALRKLLIIILTLVIASGAAYAISATIDPLEIGVGTRPLGMGKAFIAVADDANSMFLNPAGLGFVNNWGMTSIYSQLLSQITYTTIGVYRSSGDEAVGFGFVGANVGGTLYTAYIDPTTHRIVPVPGGAYAVGYTSNVFLFSYGVKLGKYFKFPESDKISAGLSFKAFFQSLTGTAEETANGFDMDIGLIYQPYRWLKGGFYGQNVLTYDMGGALRWSDGIGEAIPATYKLGVNAKVAGSEGLYKYKDDIFLNFDLEGSFLENRPIVYHLGAEWWPYNYLALRMGIDQDVYAKVAGNGRDSNLTMGVGFWNEDFGFDYAYHQYGPLSENITHYFSVSYGFPRTKPAKAATPEIEEYILIDEPLDKSIIYKETVFVTGEVIKDEVEKITIDGVTTEVTSFSQGERAKGIFSGKVQVMKHGKTAIRVGCYDKNGKLLKEYKIRLVRLPTFTDVPEGYWARDKINLLSMLNLIGGYPDGTFKPEKFITRAELTTLLVRATGLEVKPVKGEVFKDVTARHWAAKYVRVGVDRGIVTGYRDKTFKPGKNVLRVESLMMVARFAGLEPAAEVVDRPLLDIPVNHWAAKMILSAKTEGLIDFLAGRAFEPKKDTTRAEAAEMLSQTKFVKDKAKELFDWDSGFE